MRKKGEESKVAIRSIRRDAIDTIKKAKKDGDITEDDQKRQEEQAQAEWEAWEKTQSEGSKKEGQSFGNTE